MSKTFNCLVMGAAGRDFHDFQTFFQTNPTFRVRAFTAAQIPFIASRSFPKELAGPSYDENIPIYPEDRLSELIECLDIDFVFLAYSDLPHEEVMHKCSLVQSCGAAFSVLGPKQTQLQSSRPVIAITATRTGAGKSPLAQWLTRNLMSNGLRVGVIRHPMPYGDLTKQAVQRFTSTDDLERNECTVEEREEYEPYVRDGMTIFAGVNYAAVLATAESESDVILWDGGNNDYSFIRPSLSIVVADALRPSHEIAYYPGETNFRSADVIVINKVDRADPMEIQAIRRHAQQLNPSAQIITSDLAIEVESPAVIEGRRVLIVEDGPTLTHGGMSFGAATVAARQHGAAEFIDPRPFAVGSIADTFKTYPHLGPVLPSLGYSDRQRAELEETIRRCAPDVVIDGSPANLDRWLDPSLPVARVGYTFQQKSGTPLEEIVRGAIEGSAARRPVDVTLPRS